MIKFATTLLMTAYADTQKRSLNTAMSFQHLLHYFRFKIHLRASEMAHSVKAFIRMPDDPRTHFGRIEPPAESCLLLHKHQCPHVCEHVYTHNKMLWLVGSVVKRLAALLLKMQV